MIKKKWRTIECLSCSGKGIVSSYTTSGSDFLGPKECNDCGGAGQCWISPNGRYADYPGGKFRGSLPKELR